jgi:hypothetical protein
MNRRSSLFRKYAVYFVVLVTTALVGSGLIGLYFTYQESKAAALNLQSEKAAAAAVQIEAYVNEIVHQLGWMHLPLIGTSLEQRRIEYLKLLRQVPAITDVALVDKSGHEQLRASRLLTRIILENEDAEAPFCYKHGVKSVFEARRKASACLTIAQHSVCCSPRFSPSPPCCSLIN